MTTEDMNYHNDHRVIAGQKGDWFKQLDPTRMMALVVYEDYDDDDNEIEAEKWVPFVYEVCETCHGKGKHVNPSIDSGGLTREDFDNDPDFAEDYWSGAHDVECYECHGKRVVPVCTDSKHLEKIHDQERAEREYRAEVNAERRMGA